MNRGERDYDAAVEFAEDALTYSAEASPDEPRDPAWLRWVKFGAVIIFPAFVFGVGFLFADYLTQYNGQTYIQRSMAESRVNHDSIEGMRLRFIIGAVLGGGLGSIYVVRCLVRRTDP